MKQVFIKLLSFIGPLATKYISLNNKPLVARSRLFNLNPIKLYY